MHSHCVFYHVLPVERRDASLPHDTLNIRKRHLDAYTYMVHICREKNIIIKKKKIGMYEGKHIRLFTTLFLCPLTKEKKIVFFLFFFINIITKWLMMVCALKNFDLLLRFLFRASHYQSPHMFSFNLTALNKVMESKENWQLFFILPQIITLHFSVVGKDNLFIRKKKK